MRLILCLVFLVASLTSLGAQKDTLLLISIRCVINDSIEDCLESYEYDEHFNLVRSSAKNFNYNYTWYTEYTYDEESHILKKYSYEDAVFTDSTTYYYDDGKLISAFEWSESPGFSQTRITNYSPGGRPFEIKSVALRYITATWTTKEEQLEIFTYDATGRKIEYALYDLDDSRASRPVQPGEEAPPQTSDSLVYKTLFTYDSSNNSYEEHTYYPDRFFGGGQKNTFNVNNKFLKSEFFTSDTTAYTYLECTYFEQNGTPCSNCLFFSGDYEITHFNEKDKPLVITGYNKANEITSMQTYDYNDQGYLIKETDTTYLGNEIFDRKIIYTYRLVRQP